MITNDSNMSMNKIFTSVFWMDDKVLNLKDLFVGSRLTSVVLADDYNKFVLAQVIDAVSRSQN